MSASIDLNPKHHKIVSDILYEYVPDRGVLVFGSRAKWSAKDKSDLDLCIMGDEPLTMKTMFMLSDALEESPLPFKVDVVEWAKIEDGFREIIKRDGVELGWPELSLAIVAEINSESITKKNEPEIIRYVDISSVGVGQLTEPPKEMRFSEAPSRARRLVKKDDIVISSVRPNRKSRFYVTQDLADVVVSTGFAVIRPDKDFIDPTYLYSIICSDDFVDYLVRNEKGAAYPAVTQDIIGAYTFTLPPNAIQKTTAGLVSPINQKIELNQRMNETLEGMARAIFKSWFVDFDPVHAKAEGRDPEGMDAQTASLFPDSFTDDGLPEGWTQESVISSAEYINGAAYKDMHFSKEPDAWPVVKIAELKNGISPQTKFTNTDLGDKFKLDTGDILFSWSGSPDTSIDTFIWTGGKGWLNQHIFKVVNKTRAERCFAYWLLKYLKPEFIEVARNKQTTGLGHVTRKDMEWMQYCKPDQPILDLFYETVGLLLDQIENNFIQNQTLAALRDTLLPKLISGELRVDTATESLKEAS